MVTQVDTYQVESRTVIGKRVAALRRDGILPANIFGRGLESLAIQLPEREAREMLVAHGRNNLIEIQVAGESTPRPVVVRDLKQHPVHGALLHIDFYQVDLARTLRALVPVTLIGTAPAVNMYGGILLQETDTIDVEALPAAMPDHFEISIDGLAELDDSVAVGAIVIPEGVTLHTDEAFTVARVSRPRLAVDEDEVLEGEQGLVEGEEAAEGDEDADAESDDDN